MKIAFVTAGAAGMYCGSCMHDNTLARALIAAGHEVALVPLYTPLRTDEENVTLHKVFYGAINVYLQSRVPFFRHTPRLMDWLLDRPGLLAWAGRMGASTDASELGDVTLATLQGADGPQKKELERLIHWLEHDFRPDLVHLSQSLMLGLAPAIHRALAVPVVCAFQGEDLFLDELREPYRRQALELMRRHAEEVDVFFAPCEFYAALMGGRLELPAEKVRIVHLGIDPEGFAPREHPAAGEGTGEIVLGYFARLAPEKGLHQLVKAFQLLAEAGHDELRLRVAGYVSERDRPFVDEQKARVAAWGLGERAEILGETDRQGKIDFLRSLDVFSVPTVYREPKGLSILEAMATGVPVVQPRHGAFPEILEKSGGGVLVEPHSPPALAAAIGELIADPEHRRSLGERGRAAAHGEFSAAHMARETATVYAELLAGEGSPAMPKAG